MKKIYLKITMLMTLLFLSMGSISAYAATDVEILSSIGKPNNYTLSTGKSLEIVLPDTFDVTYQLTNSYPSNGIPAYIIYQNEAGKNLYASYMGTSANTRANLNLTGVKKIILANNDTNANKNISQVQIYGHINSSVNRDASKFVINNLKVTQSLNGKAVVSWDEIQSAYLKSYKVFQDGQLIGTTSTGTLTTAALSPGTEYTFRVYPVDTFNFEFTANASEKKFKYVLPMAPQISGDSNDRRIMLSMVVPANTKKYVIYRDGGQLIQNDTESTAAAVVKFEDTQLVNGQEYSYQAKVIDIYGNESELSNTIKVIPNKPVDKQPPAIPTGLTASLSSDRKFITLRWAANSDSDLAGYNLYVRKMLMYTKINDGLYNEITYKYSDIEIGETYRFRVTAVDQTGNESDPAAAEVTVTPIPVTESGQEQTNEYLLVTWNETSEAKGYVVYLNGREVSRVGSATREFKITKAMGYNPALLSNVGTVKPILADGNLGGGNNTDVPGGGNGAGGLNPSQYGIPLDVVGVIQEAVSFISIFAPWILIVIAIVFSPVLYGLIVRWIAYLQRKQGQPNVFKNKGRF